MARETDTTTTKTETQTRRITNLAAREGQQLSSLEEAVVRMHHGVSVKPEAPLATNGVNDEIMARLLEMEVIAFEKTGRGGELPDVPADATANPKTSAVLQKLKARLD